MTDPLRLSELDLDRLYEAAKQAWIALHPDATPAEYEAAMRRIAEECVV